MGAGRNIEEGVSLMFNLAALHAQGYSLPMGVPYTVRPTAGRREEATMQESGLGANLNQAPVTLRMENGTAYRFPTDPVLAVSGKNVITRRYVAKGSLRGTVKESWSLDDFEITISGVLIGKDAEELNSMVQELVDVCESGETLAVENEWLNEGKRICHLVVESYQFPHTKGLTNQAYVLKCYSDDSVKILEELQ
ncbi:MAG: hypothetical protein IJ684_02995 [Bacteroidales bacterium]|nr:hypothetical protein [Bacteroidales bacterium]